MTKPSGRLVGACCAIAAAVLWGTSYPAIAVALRESASPLWVALARGVGQSTIIGLVLIVARPRVPTSDRRSWLVLAAVGMLGAFFNVGQSLAVALSGGAIVGFVAGLYPLVAGATAPILAGDRLGRRTWMALATSALGVAVIALATGRSDEEPRGIALAGAAAIAFGLFLPASRGLTRDHAMPPLMVTMSVFVGLTVQAVLGIAVSGGGGAPEEISSSLVAALGWLILAAGVVPLFLIEVALRYNPTGDVVPYLFLTPLIAALLSVVLLGEVLSAGQVFGGGLIVIGLLVLTVPNRFERIA